MAGMVRQGLWLALPLLLAACHSQADDTAPAAGNDAAKPQPAKAADGNELIECSIGGAQWLLRECEVEKSRDKDGALVLVVHHPDGGFRRFTVLTDGRGLAPADGAQEAVIDVVDDRIDVQVGDDRYRFPATVRGHAAQK